MRINSMNKISQIYQANANMKTSAANKAFRRDSLEISSTAKDFQTALNAVKESDDIREDKVKALKEQMKAGTYEVSNQELAEKMAANVFKLL